MATNQEAHPTERTLVFCNTIQTCRDVENFLSRQKINVYAFHGAIDSSRQKANFQEFTGQSVPKKKTSGARNNVKNKRAMGGREIWRDDQDEEEERRRCWGVG
uniref:Helicase C-terminal domain-containing protein n=1 Tax=Lotharella globosa TaxID=91324 RepID=A0A7S3Z5X2_9EUKA|mmetsp:Transcript_17895/g.36133  ORF Transcript_17895/g.36133 Transcript_17895/m.36133 type:complete len:103 (-) Transcript_17895:867-1175(-)